MAIRTPSSAVVLAAGLLLHASVRAEPQRQVRNGAAGIVTAVLAGCDGASTAELGGRLPQSVVSLTNLTAAPVDFTVTMNANALFGPEHVVRTYEDVLPGTTVFPPSGGAEPGPGEFPIPFDALLGSDNVVLTVTSDVTGDTPLAQCGTFLTLVRPGVLGRVISVPVRFAVIEGAPSALGLRAGQFVPYRGNGTSTDFVSLLEGVNRVWRPQAGIVFRTAQSPFGIPVVPDVLPPGQGGIQPGDLDASSCRARESVDVAAEAAWTSIAPDEHGILVVIANQIVGCGDTVGMTPSISPDLKAGGSRAADLCAVPRRLTADDVLQHRFAAIEDPLWFGCLRAGCNTGKDAALVLAHELGHVLTLGHGDGEDNNGDGAEPPDPGPRPYDGWCDPLGTRRVNGLEIVVEDETFPGPSPSLMRALGEVPLLKVRQIEQARDAAQVVPGAVFLRSPPSPTLALVTSREPTAGALLAVDPCTSEPCDLPAELSITALQVSHTPDRALTAFALELAGALPSGASARYAILADLDVDPATGGAPQEIGIPTSFDGAEAVLDLHVTSTDADPIVSPSVWFHGPQGFALVPDPRIFARAFAQLDVELGIALGARCTVQVPDDLLGTSGGGTFRLQALAERLDASGAVDRLPRDPAAGGIVALRAPTAPTCEVRPLGLRPPRSLEVHAAGLPADRAVEIYLGERLLGHAASDGNGVVQTSALVPSDAPAGVQTLLVLVPGSTSSAAAELLVLQPPLTPVTASELLPAPNGAGWNATDVVVSLRAADPSGPGIAFVTHSATGAQPQGDTPVPGSLVDVPVVAEGITVVEYFATSIDGRVETRETRVVRVDRTSPTIAAARSPLPNAAGWNNTDVTVSFACCDAQSGVLSCPVPVLVTTEGRDQYVDGTAVDLAVNEATVRVGPIHVDKTPPSVLCGVARNLLWPPSHRMIDVGLATSVMDALDDAPAVRLRVYADEPADATGDGATVPDAELSPEGVLTLRAERQGHGEGRVYLLVLEASDAAGNTALACSTVVVPQNWRTTDVVALRARAEELRLATIAAGEPPSGLFLLLDE